MARVSNARKIERVPSLLLEEEKNKDDYYPKVVSIGPYHYKEANLASIEAFKPIAVDLFLSGIPNKGKAFYQNHILEIIPDVKRCYEEKLMPKLTDDDLAEMMLRDAAMIIVYMEISTPDQTKAEPDLSYVYKLATFVENLGMLTMAILPRDLLLLDNQIPLFVVKLLINLRYGDGEDKKLLNRYMNMFLFGEYREETSYSPREPLHLLEAFHGLVTSDCTERTRRFCFKCRWLCCRFSGDTTPAPACCSCTLLCCARDPETGVGRRNEGSVNRFIKWLACNKARNQQRKSNLKKHIYSFRTVTDLMAKGIHFRPSPTRSLKDVSFRPRLFYATLELPEWGVSIYTKVFFLNLVAYELSPNNPTEVAVASYINLMKSLVETEGDVKELRERKIFYNMLGSDEEVLNVYKDINTYGADNRLLFQHVKHQIQKHYNSRTKTWIAELLHTHFRSPWTITAFLAAVALLAISAGQLYYAINPNN